jgi:hypothetical protein
MYPLQVLLRGEGQQEKSRMVSTAAPSLLMVDSNEMQSFMFRDSAWVLWIESGSDGSGGASGQGGDDGGANVSTSVTKVADHAEELCHAAYNGDIQSAKAILTKGLCDVNGKTRAIYTTSLEQPRVQDFASRFCA